MGLLDESLWSGMVYSDGWREAHGGVRDVVEPATGAKLGTVGIANATDIATAAAGAAKAQRAWAATPFQERAAILRRAGDIVMANLDELHWWISREAGSVPAKAGLETHVTAQELYEAATLPSQPRGGYRASRAS